MTTGLKGNIWKYFVYTLTQRRSFYTLLAILFLTLPNSNAKQIGIYAAAGSFASFLLEIPTGYFADRFGHKKTLVISKIVMILSTLCFIFANSLVYFVVGSILLSASFALMSGTQEAFVHNTLIALKREKEYTKIMSKLVANVSLLSGLIIVLLPFLTKYSMLLPFYITLITDLIGLGVIITSVVPSQKFRAEDYSIKSFFRAIKQGASPGFYSLSMLVGAIGGFITADTNYRYVYLTSLGFPIILVGFVMGLSRFFWFIVGHSAHIIEKKLGIEKMLLLEIIFFPLCYFLTVLSNNPYFIAFVFSLYVGYFWGRKQIITNHFLTKFIKNKNYKATMLSVSSQIENIYEFVAAFSIGFVMRISYKAGFLTLGIMLLIIMSIMYYLFNKKKKK